MQGINSILSFFMALISLFTTIVNGSLFKREIDLNDFELVWADEFDGDSLDRTKWSTQDTTELRRGGYWNGEMVEVQDGNLTIYSKYLENGIEGENVPGWYTAQISTRDLYEQTYGYFEVRCILPKGYGQWAAFWMINSSLRYEYPDGTKGAEIDIFESAYYGTDDPNQVTSAVHWGGYADKHVIASPIYTGVRPTDPYNSFNTYGLEWNEHEYIFYINGEVYARMTRFQAAPSQEPEYMILSVEMSGANGIPADLGTGWAPGSIEDNGRDFVSEFVIDYVRCYQYK